MKNTITQVQICDYLQLEKIYEILNNCTVTWNQLLNYQLTAVNYN